MASGEDARERDQVEIQGAPRLAGERRRVWLVVRPSGERGIDLLAAEDRKTSELWAYAPLNEVRRMMASTDIPSRSVKGRGHLPAAAPDSIALLRSTPIGTNRRGMSSCTSSFGLHPGASS